MSRKQRKNKVTKINSNLPWLGKHLRGNWTVLKEGNVFEKPFVDKIISEMPGARASLPEVVQDDLTMIEKIMEFSEERDPLTARILEAMTAVIMKDSDGDDIDDEEGKEEEAPHQYFFDRALFEEALPLVLRDQLSALNKEKITMAEFAERFDRWFTFCDAVLNLGVSCLYDEEAILRGEYEEVFSTIAINKQFETAFLKPHNLKVELAHRNNELKEKSPWLAMPALIVTDSEGVEHKVAIVPSPISNIRWYDILSEFHNSFELVAEKKQEQEEFDELPYTTMDDAR